MHGKNDSAKNLSDPHCVNDVDASCDQNPCSAPNLVAAYATAQKGHAQRLCV